jgi:hypothetical protein
VHDVCVMGLSEVKELAWFSSARFLCGVEVALCWLPFWTSQCYLWSEMWGQQERFEFDEPDFALIDTLFSLGESHIFMHLVEMHDATPEKLPAGKSYADMYRCTAHPVADITFISNELFVD